jgi:hypothetical protein
MAGIPRRFNVVDDDGRTVDAVACPFCGRSLWIGWIQQAEGPRQGPVALHETITGGATDCDTYDRLDLVDFLDLALPMLFARLAVDFAARRGRA